MATRTGGLFASVTTTTKLFVSLNGGDPLSVTRTVTVLVLGPCASAGIQLNSPLAVRVAPLGPVNRLNVSVFAGRSESVAVIVKLNGLPSLIVWLAMERIGALLTSLTVTLSDLASLSGGEPLSVTRTVMVFVLGPCASVGVQVSTPVPGLMLTPEGAPGSRLNVRASAGKSASVATLTTVSVLPSLTV